MANIEQLLRDTMGLTAESVGSLTIQRAVQERMGDRGVRVVDEYWTLLHTSRGELDELIERVVVPETWFFRYPEAFAALSHVAQTAWAPAHPGGVLRVLSAPCSTGEEPYSIAIALEEAGLRPERFTVDAVDISTRALAYARRGVYGANSFRGSDAGVRERYCRPVGGRYELVDAVRSRVQFHQVNLVSDDFVPPHPSYDVVFCRNLLIYFDRATQERVLGTLRRVMAPGGYLFVGPAEAPVTVDLGFRPLKFAMAFAYQNVEDAGIAGADAKGRAAKVGTAKDATSKGVTRPLVPHTAAPRGVQRPQKRGTNVAATDMNPAPRSRASRGAGNTPGTAPSRRTPPRGTRIADRATVIPAPPVALAATGRTAGLDAARTLADVGHLDEAAAAIEHVLRDHGAWAEAYALLGIVRDAAGDPRAAETCYRRALFLEPGHVEAASHLAALLRTQGNAAGARRLEARAKRAEGGA